MKKYTLLILSGLLLSLALAGCGPKKATLEVTMSDYAFTPMTAEVPAGAEVTLNLSNTGTVEHEYVIMALGTQVTLPFGDDDEPNVFWEAEVAAGSSTSVTFTAPTEPGTYQIVCGIPTHVEQGMVGTLTVK